MLILKFQRLCPKYIFSEQNKPSSSPISWLVLSEPCRESAKVEVCEEDCFISDNYKCNKFRNPSTCMKLIEIESGLRNRYRKSAIGSQYLTFLLLQCWVYVGSLQNPNPDYWLKYCRLEIQEHCTDKTTVMSEDNYLMKTDRCLVLVKKWGDTANDAKGK